MKTAIAEAHLEVWVNCPYCSGYQNVFDKVHKDLGRDIMPDTSREIDCEDCGKDFKVEY